MLSSHLDDDIVGMLDEAKSEIEGGWRGVDDESVN